MSAEILFDICLNLHDSGTSAAAFQQLVDAGGAVSGAELFTAACCTYSSFGEVARFEPAVAAQMVAAAKAVDAKFGGFYQGKMDCLRATCCSPSLGLAASGECLACNAIKSDKGFRERLRRARAAQTDPAPSQTSKRRKDTLTVDEQSERADGQRRRVRAERKVAVRAQDAAQRWKSRFESAMAA